MHVPRQRVDARGVVLYLWMRLVRHRSARSKHQTSVYIGLIIRWSEFRHVPRALFAFSTDFMRHEADAAICLPGAACDAVPATCQDRWVQVGTRGAEKRRQPMSDVKGTSINTRLRPSSGRARGCRVMAAVASRCGGGCRWRRSGVAWRRCRLRGRLAGRVASTRSGRSRCLGTRWGPVRPRAGAAGRAGR